jgi:hypothetical protein
MIKMNLIHKFISLQILLIRDIRFLDKIRLLEFLENLEKFMISKQATF